MKIIPAPNHIYNIRMFILNKAFAFFYYVSIDFIYLFIYCIIEIKELYTIA